MIKVLVVKEYKEEIEILQKSNDNLTVEKDFLEGKHVTPQKNIPFYWGPRVSLASSKKRKALVAYNISK